MNNCNCCEKFISIFKISGHAVVVLSIQAS